MFTHRQPSPRRERGGGGPRRGVQSGQAVRRDSSKDPGEREWLCLQTRDLCGRRQRLQHTYPPRPSWALGILFTKTVTATASAAERPRRRRAPACGGELCAPPRRTGKPPAPGARAGVTPLASKVPGSCLHGHSLQGRPRAPPMPTPGNPSLPRCPSWHQQERCAEGVR